MNKPKRKKVSEMTKDEIRVFVAKKRKCEARALSTVTELMNDVIAPERLVQLLKLIGRDHYDDVTVERALGGQCGYPLCANAPDTCSKQKYKICTSNNRVYDLTERRNFCGDICYEASLHLKAQIVTEPLWLRDDSRECNFTLLNMKQRRGLPGDEVDLSIVDRIEVDRKMDSFVSCLQFVEDSLGDNTPLDDENIQKEDVVESDKKDTSVGSLQSMEASFKDNTALGDGNVQTADEIVFEIMSENSQTDHFVGSLQSKDMPLADENISYEKKNKVSNDDSLINNENIQRAKEEYESKEEAVEARSESSEVDHKIDPFVESLQPMKISVKDKPLDNENEQNYSKIVEHIKDSLEKLSVDEKSTPGQILNDDKNQRNNAERVQKTNKKTKIDPKILGEVFERKSDNKVDPFIVAGQRLKPPKTSKTNRRPIEETFDRNCPAMIQIERSFCEWFTLESLVFLFGEVRVKDMITDKRHLERFLAEKMSTSSAATHEQYQKLCRKLNLLELEDRQYDTEVTSVGNLKPLPDYSILKDESEKFNLKVNAFYKGDMVVPDAKKTSKVDEEEDSQLPHIPLTEKFAQEAFRRKIVLNALDRVLPDLLRALDLNSRELSGDVRRLVTTFDLQAHNVTFKSIQWNFVAIVVIKLLSIRAPNVEDRLKASKHLKLILLSYDLDGGYLDRLIWWLTDVDRLLTAIPAQQTGH